MRKSKGIVSDCKSDTKTSQIKPKSAKETKNETKELIISGEEVNSKNKLCSPCNYEGMNRIEIDREVKWVKTTTLKPSSHHIEIYSEEKILDDVLINSIKNKVITY
jgi:hypothetical protein